MSMLETVKRHPYVTAGAVFAVGIVLIVMMAGNSDGTTNVYTTPDNSSAVEANTALSMAQLQANVALAGIQQQGATDLANINAQLEIAKLENTRGAASDQLAAALGTLQVSTAAETQKFISQLSASVSMKQMEESTKQLQIQADTASQLTAIQAQQAKDLATISAGTISEMIQSQTKTQTNALLAEQTSSRRSELQRLIDFEQSQVDNFNRQANEAKKRGDTATYNNKVQYRENHKRKREQYMAELRAMPYSGGLLT